MRSTSDRICDNNPRFPFDPCFLRLSEFRRIDFAPYLAVSLFRGMLLVAMYESKSVLSVQNYNMKERHRHLRKRLLAIGQFFGFLERLVDPLADLFGVPVVRALHERLDHLRDFLAFDDH